MNLSSMTKDKLVALKKQVESELRQRSTPRKRRTFTCEELSALLVQHHDKFLTAHKQAGGPVFPECAVFPECDPDWGDERGFDAFLGFLHVHGDGMVPDTPYFEFVELRPVVIAKSIFGDAAFDVTGDCEWQLDEARYTSSEKEHDWIVEHRLVNTETWSTCAPSWEYVAKLAKKLGFSPP